MINSLTKLNKEDPFHNVEVQNPNINQQILVQEHEIQIEENKQNSIQDFQYFEQQQESQESLFIQCILCDQEMELQFYDIHLRMCEEQIGNINLIEQQCQDCGEQIVKLYLNDHLENCVSRFWIQVKCPYCYNAFLKAELTNHILECPMYLDQQKKEKQGIQNCSICLEDITMNKTQLNCSHSFHDICIQNWFKSKNRCPICKKVQLKLI
ncbi:unnamed protein product [Paramecium sonneborni]|uniref:RING-type domain-containing protein n=1 Tax=Paramecium sonneborni TaxID=65129 RepID=A0A8S1PVT6_9CILI|nr:unnamed protein product [Paramecium sonneborni]